MNEKAAHLAEFILLFEPGRFVPILVTNIRGVYDWRYYLKRAPYDPRALGHVARLVKSALDRRARMRGRAQAHGMRRQGDGPIGGLMLAFRTAHAFAEDERAFLVRLGEVQAEVVVAVSGDRQAPAMIGPLVADALPHGRLEPHPDLTHFGPLERPAAIAAAIAGALGLATP